jgi:tetratricopeptide (TPR) repeat protein
MPDGLDGLFHAWSAAFDAVAKEVLDGRPAFEEALAKADCEDDHERALADLSRVRSRGEHAIAVLGELMHGVEELRAEWRAARRYEREVLRRRADVLAQKVTADPRAGAQEWLAEVFDALDTLAWDAAELLADGLPWPDELSSGAQRIAAGLEDWRDGDHAAGLALMQLLGEARIDGWQGVLSAELRSRAHRLAAWLALRRLKRVDLAGEHLGRAIRLWPYAGRMHAERAAYYLSIGELDQAATDAQRAVELATDDAAGYLELGIWAELSGDFEDADQFYCKALDLLPKFDVALLGTRVAIIDPPGRLLIRATEVLLDAHRPRDAVRIADQALQADMRGPELHPQAEAHRLRSVALEQLADRSRAAAAAVDAGKLDVWNGDVELAIEQFRRAEELDPDLQDVGWLLADVRLSTSLPLGTALPDQGAVALAQETWERWAQKVGPPRGDTSWAYLTRAMIADLGTQAPGADRFAGMWEALLYVEKAIVHDDVDAQRWGYAAQYLRYVYLDELAFEAAERGYKLGAGDRQVLAEQLAQLQERGRFEEAEEVADELVTMFGNDPWVSAARAWLAIHGERETRYADALGLLELPLAEGNDPSWYYEMRALCHVGLGDLDAAREDLRALLRNTPPIGGTTKCRLAAAAVVLADPEQAARWSEEAARDPTARATTCLAANALAAFARDDLDTAGEVLAQAAERATSAVALRDMVETMLLQLPLLDGDVEAAAAREGSLRAFADGPAAARERWLAHNPPDPDHQLEAALAAYADEALPRVTRTALLAVSARRHVQAGRYDEAAARYDELVGSSFEPEATLGLTRALRGLAEEQAAVGDVDHVCRLMDRMTALGDATAAEAATAVASALERSGRYAEASEQLETAIAAATDERERSKLHQRAGGLALVQEDLDQATSHFRAALEIARSYEGHGRTGQLQIRMALISVLRHDLAQAVTHLSAAARAWKDGGALDPTAALIGELHGLQRSRGGSLEGAARQALTLVEAAVAADGDPGSQVAPLQRELG